MKLFIPLVDDDFEEDILDELDEDAGEPVGPHTPDRAGGRDWWPEFLESDVPEDGWPDG